MVDFCKSFIEQFHGLPGDTVRQKQQNLFKLLRQNHSHLLENEADLNNIATNLKATSFLEKIFRIDFLIYFRRFNELYQDFLTGDDITLSKVVKHEWFFQEAFQSAGAGEFVAEVLPTLSYALKLKILRRLPCNEQQHDEIFDAVDNRYGLSLASVILTNCSVEKIEQVLRTNLVKLSPSQLKLIFNKNPNLIDVYLEERTKHEGNTNFINYNPVLAHIAQKNPEMFAKLFDKYKFQTRLGNRTTKRYIDSQKSKILSKSDLYVDVLKKGPMVRRLGNDLKCLFFKNIRNDHRICWQIILRYYPKNQQFQVFKSVYNETFYYKFGENVDAIDEDMLRIITDPEEREKIAKQKMEKEDDDKYLCFVTSEYDMNEVTKKLDHMTSPERIQYVENATRCYIMNKNLDALLQMAKIVAVRLKNDDKDHRYNFICVLACSTLLDDLGEEHWKYIMEILAKANAEHEWIFREYFVRLKYIEYLIKNGKPIKDFVAKHPDLSECLEGEEIWKKPEICREILKVYVKVGLKEATAEQEAAEFDCKLAELCKNFNKRYPDYEIDIYNNRRILNSAKMLLEKDKRNIGVLPGIGYMICQKSSSELVKELQTLFFTKFKMSGFQSACTWFLQNEPSTFVEHLDRFIEDFPESECSNRWKLWRLIRKYSHLNIDKKIVENFTVRFQEEGFGYKKRLVRALSMLSTPEDFLKLVKSNVPTLDKVDLTEDGVKELYDIQCELVKYLHYTGDPNRILSVVLEFCKGDYLKFALSPLYSSIYRLPEGVVKPVLKKINEKQAVSVKKHGLFLACAVLDKMTANEFLKNASVPSLKTGIKYLARNPSDSVWELVEAKLLSSEKENLQVVTAMEDVKLPLEYKRKYVEMAWTLANKYESKEAQKLVIKQIHKNVINKLQPKFLCKLVEETVFKVQGTEDFIGTLLIYSGDEIMDLFLKILSEFKETQWKNKQTQLSARKKLHCFVENLFKIYAESEEGKDLFVVKFTTIFNSVFLPVEAFQEFVTISFMKFKRRRVEDCGKFLVQFNNDVVKIYSRSAINYLAKVVKKLLPYLYKTELEKMQLLYFTFKLKRSVDDCLLVIMLLPPSAPKYIEEFKLYQAIITDLENSTDVSVNLQFNLYLKSLNSDN